jgi:Mg2+ and Co2+ transporter CorA
MPLALITLFWALQGLPEEDWREVYTLSGFVAVMAWVIFWPVFLVWSLADIWTER